MSNLRNTISSLANDFAQGVLGAIRRASLEEILDESGRGGARRGPGRPAAVAAAVGDDSGDADDVRAVRRGPGRPAGRGRGGRLRRRSVDDLAELSDRIVELLEGHPDGLRAEQIREALNVQAKELPRPLNDALSARRIGKKGQKRATTYFARGAGGGGGGGGRRAGRAAGAAGGRGAGKKGGRGGKRGRAAKAAATPANGATATA